MTGRKQAALLAGAALVGAGALWQGPVVRRYTLVTGRLALGKRLRFAVASDLHSRAFGERQERLLRLLSREKPDYILMPGDILDERLDPRPALDFLRGAAGIAPSFYSPGNHEHRTGRIGAVLHAVGRCGVTVLADRLVRLETPAGRLVLAGSEGPERARHEDPAYRQARAARNALGGVEREAGLRVIMVHRPELAGLYRPCGFDLAVSGHTHGGQARVPLLMNGLYAPGQGFFPPLAGGMYDLGSADESETGRPKTVRAPAPAFRPASVPGLWLLVSRGLGGYPPLPRVFAPLELVILDVIGAGSATIISY